MELFFYLKMVQFSLGGIVFGKAPNHWWDYLTAFDDFVGNNGDPVDSGKWDTTVTENGTVSIQSNDCRIYAQATDAVATAQLTLKTALTSGKIIAIITSLGLSQDDAESVYYKYYVGNATQGFTEVATGNLVDTGDGKNTSIQPSSSLEAIYIGANKWNIFIGGTPYASNPVTLANGLKIRFYAYDAGTNTGQTTYSRVIIKEVYKTS